jgi:acetyl-CoA carboxylase biotin carboxyl carrier protein
MTRDRDDAEKAVQDARALLKAMKSGDWQELHLVSGDTEIFVARSGGGANPMISPPQQGPVAATAAVQPAPDTETIIAAPHVATLVDLLDVGSRVAAGEKVATLHVLDDAQDVEAPVAGVIASHKAQPGILVEYGDELLMIAED